MVKGRDYTLSGHRLTLKAAAVNRLAGDRSFGVRARLQARFSRGVPWSISVITYRPPALSDHRNERLLPDPHPVQRVMCWPRCRPPTPTGEPTFHFRSGATATYYVTRPGSSVTGTTAWPPPRGDTFRRRKGPVLEPGRPLSATAVERARVRAATSTAPRY
nr:hypothetical protein [Streptomyces alanosinicus]